MVTDRSGNDKGVQKTKIQDTTTNYENQPDEEDEILELDDLLKAPSEQQMKQAIK